MGSSPNIGKAAAERKAAEQQDVEYVAPQIEMSEEECAAAEREKREELAKLREMRARLKRPLTVSGTTICRAGTEYSGMFTWLPRGVSIMIRKT